MSGCWVTGPSHGAKASHHRLLINYNRQTVHVQWRDLAVTSFFNQVVKCSIRNHRRTSQCDAKTKYSCPKRLPKEAHRTNFSFMINIRIKQEKRHIWNVSSIRRLGWVLRKVNVTGGLEVRRLFLKETKEAYTNARYES